MLFILRFDLRNPAFAGVDMADRYEAALAMTEWADRRGALAVSLSEHHGSEDGYLPSPLVMAAAIAARTTNIAIAINALIAPFHDPLRLAEDIAVVDQLSRGRLHVTIAGGYAAHEFEMFGVELLRAPGARPRDRRRAAGGVDGGALRVPGPHGAGAAHAGAARRPQDRARRQQRAGGRGGRRASATGSCRRRRGAGRSTATSA